MGSTDLNHRLNVNSKSLPRSRLFRVRLRINRVLDGTSINNFKSKIALIFLKYKTCKPSKIINYFGAGINWDLRLDRTLFLKE